MRPFILPAPAAPSFDAFRESTQRSIETIGSKLPPDGEWAATLLMESAKGFCILPIGEHETNAPEDLGWCAAAIASVGATRAARIQGAVERGVDRELIILHVVEPERHECWVADVHRHEDAAPTLEPWVTAQSMGPIGDAMRLAVTAANAQN